jgi:hypothetical protein
MKKLSRRAFALGVAPVVLAMRETRVFAADTPKIRVGSLTLPVFASIIVSDLARSSRQGGAANRAFT